MKHDIILLCSTRRFLGWRLAFPLSLSWRSARSISLAVFLTIPLLQFGLPNSAEAQDRDPVIVIPGILGSAERNGKWILDPIFHVYDDLTDRLQEAGYVSSSTLFAFPYDWRRSNIETGKLLKKKIEAIKNSCACSKVDIVAHSMGGLVARSYIQSADYAGDVDRIVFLGTPIMGSPEAYLMWEGGEIRSNGISSWVLELILKHQAKENGYPDLFSYIRNYPVESVRELLPVYNYLRFPGDATPIPYNYTQFPQNPFLEVNILGTDSARYDAGGPRIFNILSDTNTSTLGSIDVDPSLGGPTKWLDGYPIGFANTIGDGTVPAIAAYWSVRTDKKIDSSHLDLPTKSETQILEALSASDRIVNEAPLPATKSITFGNSDRTHDMAQSFTVSSALKLTDVHMYLRRTAGAGTHITISLVKDEGGNPGRQVIASTTDQYPSIVEGLYTWIRVPIVSEPLLSPGITYWIVAESNSSFSSAYYLLAANSSFPGGEARVGNFSRDEWFTTSPEGLSAYFKVSLADPVSPVSSALHHISKMLTVMVFSPVDIMITGPDGKRVGRDPLTGQEINEIGGAFYSGFDSEDEFITIPDPTDGQYKIDAIGTGEGEFSIEVAEISDTSEATTTLSGVATTDATSTFMVSVEDGLVENLTVEPGPQSEPAVVPPIPEPISVSGNSLSSERQHVPHVSSRLPKVEVVKPHVELVIAIDAEQFAKAYKDFKEPERVRQKIQPERMVSETPSVSVQNTASVYDGSHSFFHRISAFARRLVKLLW